MRQARQRVVVVNSRKVTVAVVPVLLLSAAVAASFLGPWSPREPASLAPVGYITFWLFDVAMSDTTINPPALSQACTVIGVNNSGKTIDSILFKFSTQSALTFAGDSSGFSSRVGDFRSTRPLTPGSSCASGLRSSKMRGVETLGQAPNEQGNTRAPALLSDSRHSVAYLLGKFAHHPCAPQQVPHKNQQHIASVLAT
jgi:hypothetical protein